MNKKLLFLILPLIIVAGCRVISGEDNWICQNGQWIKHGNPSAPQPTEVCGNLNDNQITTNPNIIVEFPQPNALVTSPLLIKGQARGNWYFEASFPIELVDAQQKVITSAIAQAQGDWMTEDFVPFMTQLEFAVAENTPAVLILKKDNPSGLPQHDAQIRLPLLLQKTATTTIKVFFNNNELDPEISCVKVFPVTRMITKIPTVARAAVEELLKGPTETEKKAGYSTSINPNVTIRRLVIQDGVAEVDFDKQIEFQVGGSCRVGAIRSQITQTLKQFPTVKEIRVSVEGRTEDVLQP